MKQILILESNPNRDLALNQEIRDLEATIAQTPNHPFTITTGLAVRPSDLQNLLLKHQPHIVHFCGHGTGETGLIFQNDRNQPQLVSTEALTQLFSLCADHLECVLLNACYSETQATTIIQYIPYAIGMQQAIRDDAARYFSEGFYRALAYGKSIEQAYQWGCNAIQLMLADTSTSRKLLPANLDQPPPTQPLPEHLKPILRKKSLPLPSSLQPTTYNFTLLTLTPQGQENRTPQQAPGAIEPITPPIELIQIPAGSFTMGSTQEPNEQPPHRVTLESFYISRHPITQAQWRSIAHLPEIDRPLTPEPSHFKGDRLPVEQISWLDAIEFCHRLSQFTGRQYRLPTEAEWEYACRAGTDTNFHFGDRLTPSIANYNSGNALTFMVNFLRGSTSEVGKFQVANAFGLYDMHGNIWEWCLDDWHDNYQNAPSNGHAWLNTNSNQHPVRGGSWDFNQTGCRSTFRVKHPATSQSNFLGFRIVCAAAK